MCAPKAPDPYETAAAQAGSNRDTAITQMQLNTVDQFNPWGNVTYDKTGFEKFRDSQGNVVRTPTYSQTTSFNPQTQAIFDSYMGTMGNLSSLAQDQSAQLGATLGQGVSMGNAPGMQTVDMQTGPGRGFDAGYGRGIGGGYSTQLGDGYATTYAGADNFSADRDKVEGALWERGGSVRASEEEALRSRLANQGIAVGSEAYNAEMERMGRQRTDERLAITGVAGQEQSRLVNMARDAAMFGNQAIMGQGQFTNQAALDRAQFGSSQQAAQNAALMQRMQMGNQAQLQGAQFNNATRDQYLSEQLALRNQRLNEMGSLFGMGGSSLQSPGTYSGGTPSAGVGGVDLAGLINSNYQNQVSQSNSAMGGLFGLGASAIGLFSDRRLKTDVERVGTTNGGTPIYSYRYIWGGPTHIGVMAQDVPEAAFETDSGFLAVDYAKVQ